MFGESGAKPDKTDGSVVTTEQQTVNTTEAAEEKSEKADVSSDVYYLMETIDQDPYWSVQVKMRVSGQEMMVKGWKSIARFMSIIRMK